MQKKLTVDKSGRPRGGSGQTDRQSVLKHSKCVGKRRRTRRKGLTDLRSRICPFFAAAANNPDAIKILPARSLVGYGGVAVAGDHRYGGGGGGAEGHQRHINREGESGEVTGKTAKERPKVNIFF